MIKSLTQCHLEWYPFLIIVFVWVVAPPAHSRQQLEAAIIDFYPFGWQQNEQAQGMFVEMIEGIGKQAGLSLRSQIYPVARALRNATLGQSDLLISYRDEVMVPNVEFLGSVGCLVAQIVPARAANIKRVEDLDGKRVGYVGQGYFEIRHAHNMAIERLQLSNNLIMLKMLFRARLDAVVINDAVLNAYLVHSLYEHEFPPDWRQVIDAPIVLNVMDTHLSISKASPFYGLRDQLSDAVYTLSKQGYFAALFRKYGSSDGGTCLNLVDQ